MGFAENFGGIQRGVGGGESTKICLENEDMVGGDPGSHQMLLGGITSVK